MDEFQINVLAYFKRIAEALERIAGVETVEEPETPTEEPTPTEPEVVVPRVPIWQEFIKPTYSAPTTLEVPSGQNVVWIPVEVSNTDYSTVFVHTFAAVNQNPATINVGTNQAAFLNPEFFRFSLGDDKVHYIRLQFPRTTYSDGQSVRISLRGIGTANEWVQVNVIFRNGATFPDMPPQFHRAPRELNLTNATRKNSFVPREVEWSDTGFKGEKRVFRSRLSHGYSQDGNGETGLYMNEEVFPTIARNPISYDETEDAIRLRTAAAPEGQPFEYNRRTFRHQAAVIQGQTMDELCGTEGVWLINAKMPSKRYTWPAFWLVGRGNAGRRGSWTAWPPEIDIVEIFNQIYNNDSINGYRISSGQHFGNYGSNSRLGAYGIELEANRVLGTTQRTDDGYHTYACAVVWRGNDAEVTFFFDGKEITTTKLLARHEDMTTRVELFPIANVAVRAPTSWTETSWNNDTRLGDMLIKDIALYTSGFTM